jgi:hypothetical protein
MPCSRESWYRDTVGGRDARLDSHGALKCGARPGCGLGNRPQTSPLQPERPHLTWWGSPRRAMVVPERDD